jgi:hypothetical protein
MYFARAVVLAIYGDEPDAKKSLWPDRDVSSATCRKIHSMWTDNGIAARVPRDRRRMKKRKRALLLLMSTSGAPECAENALKKAKSAGMSLRVDNGTWGSDTDWNWVFGPDPSLGNVYQDLPQVSLHRMDEGFTAKSNLGCIRAAVAEILKLNAGPKPKPGKKKKKWWSKAAVCRRMDRQVALRPLGLFLICTCHEFKYKF